MIGIVASRPSTLHKQQLLMINSYKKSVFAYEDTPLTRVLVGLQKLAERMLL